ncbi:MAG: thiol:disulfide interchange protein DsbA/DsbL [Rubrivivax sp.]|nr:thiol:disulfide interchange protein DsbA/DsbL [Rubrivivax sp.]
MKRRDFSLQLASAGLGLAVAGPATAQGAPIEAKNYVKLQTVVPVALPSPQKKIEVIEFFSYSCPHCFDLEPVLERWVKTLAPDVYFRQVPVGFSLAYQMHQKLFFALEEIGQREALHRKVFGAIHQQRRPLNTEAEMLGFLTANGIDGAKFTDAFRSFAVNTKAARAKQLSEAYKLDGVPTLGIHGRYLTSASLAGSHERAVVVADYLIQQVRQTL